MCRTTSPPETPDELVPPKRTATHQIYFKYLPYLQRTFSNRRTRETKRDFYSFFRPQSPATAVGADFCNTTLSYVPNSHDKTEPRKNERFSYVFFQLFFFEWFVSAFFRVVRLTVAAVGRRGRAVRRGRRRAVGAVVGRAVRRAVRRAVGRAVGRPVGRRRPCYRSIGDGRRAGWDCMWTLLDAGCTFQFVWARKSLFLCEPQKTSRHTFRGVRGQRGHQASLAEPASPSPFRFVITTRSKDSKTWN